MLAYEFAKEIMQPTDGKDEDVPPMVEPNSAGREGPVPVLVKCAKNIKKLRLLILFKGCSSYKSGECP